MGGGIMTPSRDSRSRVSRVGDGGTFKVLTLAVLVAVGMIAAPAVAQVAAQETAGELIAADQAMRLAMSGEIVVVDVRSPQEWQQTGVVLSVKRHGETSAIADVFTRDNGRWKGLVRGGRSRTMRPVLQPGNVVEATWRARLADVTSTSRN